MTGKIWDKIIERVSIPEIYPKTLDSNGYGECAIRNSKSKTAFNYHPETKSWCCWSCGSVKHSCNINGGDVISLYAHIHNIDRWEAIRDLAKEYKIPFEPKESKEDIETKTKIEAIFIDFMIKCFNNLKNSEYYDFVIRKRGFTEETMEEFNIGLFDDSVKKDIEKIYNNEELKMAGFKSEKDNWIIGKRIVYPYLDINGKPIYFIYRLIDSEPDFNENAKYVKQKVTDFVQNILFGYNSLKRFRDKPLIITEGMTDSISVIQANYPCLSPITIRLKKEDFENAIYICKRYKKVVIINDNEENQEGLKGAIDILKFFLKNGINAFINEIPNPENLPKIDLDDYLKKGDTINDQEKLLQKLVDNSFFGFHYLLDQINKKSNQKEIEDILDLIPENDVITKFNVIEELKDKTQLGKRDLEKIFLLIKEKQKKEELKTEKGEKRKIEKDHYDIATEIIKNNPMYFPDEYRQGPILVYKDGVYREKNTRYIESRIIVYFEKNDIKEFLSINIINLIRKIIISKISCTILDFDNYVNLINVKNGILNISNPNNIKLLPHHPNFKMRIQLPTKYEEDAQCPKIEKLIKDIFGDKNTELVYEFMGDCITGEIKQQKSPVLTGSGNNGKSTFLELLKIFIGFRNCSKVSLYDLERDKFATSRLENKLVNLVDDLPLTPLKFTSIFKTVVGDKTLEGQRKYGHRYMFRNRAKHIFACNNIPKTYDDSYAFFRRWMIINCERVFNGNERDPNILRKVCTPEGLSGLLNKALEGLERLEKRTRYDKKYYCTVEHDWEILSNPITEFIDNFCIIDDSFKIERFELLNAYNKFRKEQNLNKASARKLSRELGEQGIKIKKKQVDGVNYKNYMGIKLKLVDENGEYKEKETIKDDIILDEKEFKRFSKILTRILFDNMKKEEKYIEIEIEGLIQRLEMEDFGKEFIRKALEKTENTSNKFREIDGKLLFFGRFIKKPGKIVSKNE